MDWTVFAGMLAVAVLAGAAGICIGWVFGYMNGQRSNAEGFRAALEHHTRDSDNYTGA